MKLNYLKYSDERNRRFSIRTEVVNEEGKKTVYKEAIFPEGKEHIEKMQLFYDRLKEYYSEVEMCPARKQGDGVEFAFIEGENLSDRYGRIAQSGDTAAYEELLTYHRKLICGDAKNSCVFETGAEFEKWFGDADGYTGKKGLVYANFDAIASNIILKDDTPYFIDYEWVMEFKIPKDLAVYHCIRDGYMHNPELEQFYPFHKVMEFLGIESSEEVLEQSYCHFYDYVISDEQGRSYAKDKYCCLKNIRKIDEVMKEWEKCADNWKAAVAANQDLEEKLKNAKAEWQKCADEWEKSVQANKECEQNWRAALQANENLEKELESAKAEWLNCANEWKKSVETVQNLERDLKDLSARHDQLEIQYQTIINTKTWRAHEKIKNTLHR